MPGRAPRVHWPHALTGLRVVLVIPVVALTLAGTDAAMWVAFGAFAVAALTDGLDGYVARRMRLVSSAGAMWDPIADKMLVIAAMAALVVVGRFPLWAASVIVVREAAVTVLRLMANRRGRGFPASPAGKAKTGAQLLAVLLILLPFGGAWETAAAVTLAVAVALTVISGVEYFLRAPGLLAGRER